MQPSSGSFLFVIIIIYLTKCPDLGESVFFFLFLSFYLLIIATALLKFACEYYKSGLLN